MYEKNEVLRLTYLTPLIFRNKIKILILFLISFSFVLIKVFVFPIYESTATIMVDYKKNPTSVESEKIDARDYIGYIRMHMELLKSRPVIEKLIEQLELYKDFSKSEDWQNSSVFSKKIFQSTVEKLQKKYITIANIPLTNLVEVTVKYKKPEKAAKIANTLVDIYIDWSIGFLHKEADKVGDFVEKELDLVHSRLMKSEDELKKFEEENSIINLSEEAKIHLNRQAEFESRYSCAEIQEKELKMRLKAIHRRAACEYGKSIPSISTAENPVVRETEIKLLELEIELSRLLELYTEESPQVRYTKKRILQVKKRLNDEISKILNSEISIYTINPIYQNLVKELIHVETEAIGVKAQKKAISESIKNYGIKLKDIPKKELKLARLMRDIKINEALYRFLIQENENIQLLKAKQTTENIKIVSPAVIPLKPKGRLLNLLIGGVISLIVSLGMPYLMETSKDVKR